MSKSMLSTYELLNFSETLVAILVPVALAAIAMAGLFKRIKISGDVAHLSRLGTIVVIALALPLVLMAVPFWDDIQLETERRPFCSLGQSLNDDGKNLIYWFIDSNDAVLVKLTNGDGDYTPVQERGEMTLNWAEGEVSKRFKILAENRYDYCLREVRVFNPRILEPLKLHCSLELAMSPNEARSDYRISWSVKGRDGTVAYINGAEVANEGHANFTFNGPNYDRFRLVANAHGKTCENEVMVFSDDL